MADDGGVDLGGKRHGVPVNQVICTQVDGIGRGFDGVVGDIAGSNSRIEIQSSVFVGELEVGKYQVRSERSVDCNAAVVVSLVSETADFTVETARKTVILSGEFSVGGE